MDLASGFAVTSIMRFGDVVRRRHRQSPRKPLRLTGISLSRRAAMRPPTRPSRVRMHSIRPCVTHPARMNACCFRVALPVCAAFALTFSSRAGDDALSLAGQWRFQLDREDAGVKERWFERGWPSASSCPARCRTRALAMTSPWIRNGPARSATVATPTPTAG